MNTVQHNKSTVTHHEIVMDGPITARDVGDFIHQVKIIFEAEMKRDVLYDDDYYVTGDGQVLIATFDTKSEL